ncbi:MAG: polysaccharide pyruvyl transferase family protein [Desulfobacterales bacterium]
MAYYVKRWMTSLADSGLRLFGLRSAYRPDEIAPRESVIIGGYGYGNTGDEAQLGANLERWRTVCPKTQVLVLSPHPAYTADHHACRSALASRVVLFQSNKTTDFEQSSLSFRVFFWPTLIRMELNAQLMRAGLAPMLATSSEARLLLVLQSAVVVHVSGGGFMTGPTRSRLWDACLLLRLCQRLGTPYFLTGQTIGILQNQADRWLARTALCKAIGISLRDPGKSQSELESIGVPRQLLFSGVDDALFCTKADEKSVAIALSCSGVAPKQVYLAVNYHWWGMDQETRKQSSYRLAYVLDSISEKFRCHVLFVPMVHSDEEAQMSVIANMKQKASMLSYDYKYPLVRGVIASAQLLVSFKHHPLIFGLGEGVPCLSISFDPYYHRKNTGAMANLGQDRFCLDREAFFSQYCEDLIVELVEDKYHICASLKTHLFRVRDAQHMFFAQALKRSDLNVAYEHT